MQPRDSRIILWVGAKHSGKTTAVSHLVENIIHKEFTVAGILSVSVYQGSELRGYDVVDITTRRKEFLARIGQTGLVKFGKFGFSKKGLMFGNKVLMLERTLKADLVVVDEFGPMELHGSGWRESVDFLIEKAKGMVMLVSREEIVTDVVKLYESTGCEIVNAGMEQSQDRVSILPMKSYAKWLKNPDNGARLRETLFGSRPCRVREMLNKRVEKREIDRISE